jgi:hypothetical protein
MNEDVELIEHVKKSFNQWMASSARGPIMEATTEEVRLLMLTMAFMEFFNTIAGVPETTTT